MSSPHSDQRLRSRRRLIISLIAAGLILLILAGVGIYGLITGPTQSVPDRDAPRTSPTVPQAPGEEPGAPVLSSLPRPSIRSSTS